MGEAHIITVNTSLCARCGLCRKDCPHGLWSVTDRGAEIASQSCLKCGHCVAICPEGAISMSGYPEMPEEINSDMKPEPEALMTLIKCRRSIRHFTPQDVSPEIVDRIIEAGRYTPTARNTQGVSYVILRENMDEYERIAVSLFRGLRPIVGIFYRQFKHFQIDDRFFFKGAPVVIVVKAKNVVDGALAASAMELVARAYGVGVLYSGLFSVAARFSRRLKQKLSADSGERIVTALVLGHPAVKYQRTAQRECPKIRYD